LATRWKVVESLGLTLADPFGSTLLGPSVTSVAFVVCHVKVVDCPFSIVFGLADNDAVGAAGGGGGGGGGGATFFLHAPSSMIAAKVKINIAHLFVVLCFT
jgi:hypothetical protein